jgi:hypothetical protein
MRSPVTFEKLLPVSYSPLRWQPMQVFVHDAWHDTQSMRSVCAKPLGTPAVCIGPMPFEGSLSARPIA